MDGHFFKLYDKESVGRLSCYSQNWLYLGHSIFSA